MSSIAIPTMSSHRVMLLVLAACIVLVVVLNMSYLPKIVTTSIDYSTGNLSLDFSEQSKNSVSMEKVKEWSEKRKEAKVKAQSEKNKLDDKQNSKQQRSSSTKTATTANASNSGAQSNSGSSKIAGLNCDKYGGPSEDVAAEMVYWRDIPTDAKYHSPHYDSQTPKYLTFEPDEGGWNNIRMSMETAVALAHAMGRILVLPPEQNMYLLDKDEAEKNRFTFRKFFPFDDLAEEHPAVDVISMDEFLKREVLTGSFKDTKGKIVFPPGNQTIFEGHVRDGKHFWSWWRKVTDPPIWDFSRCVVGIAKDPGPEGTVRLKQYLETLDLDKNPRTVEQYIDNPTPVDAPPSDRLREMLAHRREICIYDDNLQKRKVMHFMGDNDSGARLLVHFYAYLFFEDWKQDLWTKRYVRDHLRYIDEIQCAAATIVRAVREKARANGDPEGQFDSMHIRRGDFQYKETRIEAEEILENIEDIIPANATLFIATDERKFAFFKPLMNRYKVYFLKDFQHLVPNLNKNYYGMLDQLIASRGRTFAGAYYSTFTGYIARMRGYHTQKDKTKGWKEGIMNSYYYVEEEHKSELVHYFPLKGPLWGREFPVAWRDIDHDVHPSQIIT
ncbi:GDP-fucose protein O-fucosyltransferase [Nitzschia inconspicua]|uniref:GDP-fucose protein O-fucosyltransferase n=1 Tax=Nitzschia inconspicua TaxID=303405 RepID=A0A9K3Q2P1_9STRA|nr:GDP-fucose protein O-fucosyltransferase [Nitzschia inconspicua]